MSDLARDYDIVLLDPPPALGTISLAVMQAANALLVPLAATTPDFCSTVQFLSMMDQVLQQLDQAGIQVDYGFVRLICSKFDGNDPSHSMIRAIMEQTFGPALLPVSVLDSAEISHASLRMMSVYELERPIGTPKTHKRCRANLDEALGQVEQLIRQGWGRVAPASEEELARMEAEAKAREEAAIAEVEAAEAAAEAAAQAERSEAAGDSDASAADAAAPATADAVS